MSDFIRGFRDSVIVVVLTVALVLASSFIPAIAIADIFVCGVPAAFLAAKHKMKFTIPALLVIFAVFYCSSLNIISAFDMMLMLVIPGAVAGYMLGEKRNFYSGLLAVCVTVSVGWLLSLYMMNTSIKGGISGMLDAMKPQLESSVMQSFKQAENIGLSPDVKAMASAVPQMVDMALGTIRLFLPAYMVAFSAVVGYAVLRLCGFFVRVTKAAGVSITPFCMMKAPRSMSTVAVLCYIISFFVSADTAFGAVIANAAFVLEFFLAVCGISFIDFLLKKAIRFTALRWLIYAGALMFLSVSMMLPMVSYGFVILGILDAGRNFRRIEEVQDDEF